jgi:uncharacterized protein YlzI (FlbEa/FlbD family)
MKITTWANIDPIEVEVTLEDIRASLHESPDTTLDAVRLINRCYVVLESIDPQIIGGMSSEQRQIISEFFTEQAAKYREGEQ